MAFDESLAARIRDALSRKKGVEEKKMFGLRLLSARRQRPGRGLEGPAHRPPRPDEGEAALREPHVRVFDITGRPKRNWVVVEPEGVGDDGQLAGWIERAIKFVRTLRRSERRHRKGNRT